MVQRYLVASGKGGVGKSTICSCLGAAFARRGDSVLIVEGDCGFRGLDLFFGLEGTALYDIEDVLEERCSPERAVLQVSQALHLLCASLNPAYEMKPQALQKLFSWAEQQYSCILVDGAAGFGTATERLSSFCSAALVVTTPDGASVRAAGQISRLLKEAGLQQQRLIINRIPKHFSGDASIRDLDDVIDLTGIQLIGAVPEDRKLHAPAALLPSGQGGQELERIAGRLEGKPSALVLYH